jgi:hypothetical protein
MAESVRQREKECEEMTGIVQRQVRGTQKRVDRTAVMEECFGQRDRGVEEVRTSLDTMQRQLRESQVRVDILMIAEESMRQRDRELEEMRESLDSTQKQLERKGKAIHNYW